MSLRKKSILLGVAFGIYFSLYFVATDEQVYFSSIIIKTSMGICELSYDGIIQITMNCFPILIYLIVFGTDIYRHFCTASTYVFTRCENRSKWCIKEMWRLFFNTLLYVVLVPAIAMLIASIKNKVVIDKPSLILYLYYVAIYTMFLFGMALFINVMSIKIGTVRSYGIVVAVIMCLIVMLCLWISVFPLESEKMLSYDLIIANGELLKYDLFSHLILFWHSSTMDTLNSRINLFGINYDLSISLKCSIVFAVIMIIIGYVIIKEIDFINVNKEMEN